MALQNIRNMIKEVNYSIYIFYKNTHLIIRLHLSKLDIFIEKIRDAVRRSFTLRFHLLFLIVCKKSKATI